MRRIPREAHSPERIPPGLVRLPRSFYRRPTLTVARDLVGVYILRRTGRTLLAARIVEVEAYLGDRDPASHAFRGQTPRNRVMFREGGHLYVYFTYGMHFCANVVTGPEGVGTAVLLRAAEPVAGIRTMARNRAKLPGDLRSLCAGPARLCRAFAFDRRHDGTDLCADRIWLARDPRAVRPRIARSQRIGISSGKGFLWRFTDRDSPYLSRPPRP